MKPYFKMPVRDSRAWYSLWAKKVRYSKRIAEMATLEANIILANLEKKNKKCLIYVSWFIL